MQSNEASCGGPDVTALRVGELWSQPECPPPGAPRDAAPPVGPLVPEPQSLRAGPGPPASLWAAGPLSEPRRALYGSLVLHMASPCVKERAPWRRDRRSHAPPSPTEAAEICAVSTVGEGKVSPAHAGPWCPLWAVVNAVNVPEGIQGDNLAVVVECSLIRSETR